MVCYVSVAEEKQDTKQQGSTDVGGNKEGLENNQQGILIAVNRTGYRIRVRYE